MKANVTIDLSDLVALASLLRDPRCQLLALDFNTSSPDFVNQVLQALADATAK